MTPLTPEHHLSNPSEQSVASISLLSVHVTQEML